MADEIKQKHLQDNPEYSYQPRKPSEKKRRMTRRKAAVLADISQTLVAPTDSASLSATGSAADLPLIIPNFEKTESGNAIVNIGDAHLSDTLFSAMLDVYNEQQPAMVNPTMQFHTDNSPPLIYMEDDEVSADDKEYYDHTVDWDKLIKESQETAAKFAAPSENPTDAEDFYATLSLAQQTTLFDLNNSSLFDAELALMSSAFEQDTLQEDTFEEDTFAEETFE